MLRPGDEPIPGYQLERFLGKGQFGQVWQSSSPGKTALALKFLNLGGKEGWREFRSIQQIKGVRHAHLMPITALWLLDEQGRVLDDDLMASIASTANPSPSETLVVEPRASRDAEPAWLVVAQLLGDKTLADRLKEHQDQGHPGIPVDELLTYMEEVAKGIDFLNSPQHDLGAGKVALQHCDIKPANILLMGGSVLICDFGVTRTLAGQGMSTTATSMVGSPAYMAPECIERRPSNASDQYSLAVTYYELRSGQLPFEKLEYMDVLEAHKHGRLDFSRVSPAERKVLQRATALQPKDRYATTAEMVGDLRHAVAGVPAAARGRWPVVTAGALVVAAASLVGFALNLYWNRGPVLVDNNGGGAAQREWQLQVIPSDSEVLFDGEKQTAADDGIYRGAWAEHGVQVTVRHPPEYVERVESFAGDDLRREPKRTITLPGDAKYYVAQAEQLQQLGKLDDAAKSYQLAIAVDSKLATFPPTQWLLAPQATFGKVRCLAVGRDRRQVAAGGDAVGSDSAMVRLWQPNDQVNGFSSRDLTHHGGEVFGVVLTDRYLVSADYRGHVEGRTIDESAAAGFELTFNPGILVSRASPDGRWLVIASPKSDDSGSIVAAWDLQQVPTSDNAIRLAEHDMTVPALAISDDSQTVVSADWDGVARIAKLTPTGNEPMQVASWSAESAWVYAVGLSHSRIYLAARFVLSVGDEPVNRLVVVGLDGTKPLPFPSGHAAAIETVAVSPHGKWVASGCEDGFIQLWPIDDDANTAPIRSVPLPDGHRGRVAGIVFDDNEQWMVSGGDDGKVLFWDIRPNHLGVTQLGKHEGPIAAVRPLADGRVVTGGEDGAVRIWDIQRCQLIKSACDNLRQVPAPADSTPSRREI